MFQVGQIWRDPSGVIYHVESHDGDDLEVSIHDRDGLVTAGADRWLFTTRRFGHLIATDRLSLVDAGSRLDAVAERLERVGLDDIAAQLDELSESYGAVPKRLRQRHVREAEEMIENADDSVDSERTRDQIERARDILRESGDRVSAPHTVEQPHHTVKPNAITEPNRVSKG